MRVRPATVDDTDRIVEMAINFLLLTPYGKLAGPNIEPLALGALIRTVMEAGVILVAETAGGAPGVCVDIDGDRWHPVGSCSACRLEVVGMLALYVATHPLTGEEYGDEIAWWVDVEHRKGRAGWQLLRAAETWARARRLSVLKMVAPEPEAGVGRFYERIGYTRVETVYQKSLRPQHIGGILTPVDR